MKTVGIIGGSGFIGSHVTKKFLANGYKVRVSSTDISNSDKYKHLKQLPDADNLEIVQLDVGVVSQNLLPRGAGSRTDRGARAGANGNPSRPAQNTDQAANQGANPGSFTGAHVARLVVMHLACRILANDGRVFKIDLPLLFGLLWAATAII